jgi:hypothetical protein
MMTEPTLTGLSVTLRNALNGPYRMLRGDEKLRWRQRSNEDDASVRLERQGVWRLCVSFETRPLAKERD